MNKRFTGRRVYEYIAFKRPDSRVDAVMLEGRIEDDTARESPMHCLKLIEDFREVTRPSRDAVELAKNVIAVSKMKCPDQRAEVKARAILDAEAAFAEVVVPPPPEYDPQDVAFARDLAAITPPLTYTLTRHADGSGMIVLRSFAHERGCDVIKNCNGIKIISDRSPEWFSAGSLFLQGLHEKSDEQPITVPPADLPRVLAALTEYGAVEVADDPTIAPPPTEREIRWAKLIDSDDPPLTKWQCLRAEAADVLAAAKETDRGHS